MANFCIMPEVAKKIREDLKNGKLKISDLVNADGAKIQETFKKYVGEHASDVALEFEKKLILKRKVQGVKNFISKYTQTGKYDVNKVREMKELLKEYEEAKLKRILSPEAEQSFLSDLAEAKTGISMSRKEAKKLYDLYEVREELLSKKNEKTGEFDNKKDKIKYGLADVLYKKYAKSLENPNKTILEDLKDWGYKIKTEWKMQKDLAIKDVILDIANTFGDTLTNVVASWDQGFIGRQGLATLQTNPKIWGQTSKNAFINSYKILKGKGIEVEDAFWANIYSNKNYLNGNYDKAGILIKREEQFRPRSDYVERVPVVGKLFEASRQAYSLTATEMRTKLFDYTLSLAEGNRKTVLDKILDEVPFLKIKEPPKIDDVQIQDIGKVIGSLTGVGQIGRGKGILELALWAPRMLKGNWDVLTAHAGQKLTPFAKRQAVKNILMIVVETYIFEEIMKGLLGEDAIEDDPTSSMFGKVKAGNTGIDYTGGKGGIITFASRMVTGKYKSATTGIKKEFKSGYAGYTKKDALVDFAINKTTPAARILIDILEGEMYGGKKTTLKEEIKRMPPITVQNIMEDSGETTALKFLGVLSDFLGFSSNVYQFSNVDWNTKESKEMIEFKNKVGDEDFKKANQLYNDLLNDWFDGFSSSPEYEKMSDEEKQKNIDKVKETTKKEVLNQF